MLTAALPSEDRLADFELRLRAVEQQLREICDGRVDGWDDIARELLMSRSTAIRAAQQERDPLPAERAPGGEVWIWRSALVAWARRNHLPHQAARRIEELEREVGRLARELEAIRQSATALPENARDPSTGVVHRRVRS